METTDIVETETDISIGKIVVIAAGLTLAAIGTKQLVGIARTKLAARRNTTETTTVDEDN